MYVNKYTRTSYTNNVTQRWHEPSEICLINTPIFFWKGCIFFKWQFSFCFMIINSYIFIKTRDSYVQANLTQLSQSRISKRDSIIPLKLKPKEDILIFWNTFNGLNMCFLTYLTCRIVLLSWVWNDTNTCCGRKHLNAG